MLAADGYCCRQHNQKGSCRQKFLDIPQMNTDHQKFLDIPQDVRDRVLAADLDDAADGGGEVRAVGHRRVRDDVALAEADLRRWRTAARAVLLRAGLAAVDVPLVGARPGRSAHATRVQDL